MRWCKKYIITNNRNELFAIKYGRKLSVRIELTISGLLDQRLTTWPQELFEKPKTRLG